MDIPRHPNTTLYVVVAVLFLAGSFWRQYSTDRINRDRAKLAEVTVSIFNECWSKGIGCRGSYPAYLEAWDQSAQNAHLLKSMEKEIAAQATKQDERRKAELIEAAIKSLKKDGITEDDLRGVLSEDDQSGEEGDD